MFNHIKCVTKGDDDDDDDDNDDDDDEGIDDDCIKEAFIFSCIQVFLLRKKEDQLINQLF